MLYMFGNWVHELHAWWEHRTVGGLTRFVYIFVIERDNGFCFALLDALSFPFLVFFESVTTAFSRSARPTPPHHFPCLKWWFKNRIHPSSFPKTLRILRHHLLTRFKIAKAISSSKASKASESKIQSWEFSVKKTWVQVAGKIMNNVRKYTSMGGKKIHWICLGMWAATSSVEGMDFDSERVCGVAVVLKLRLRDRLHVIDAWWVGTLWFSLGLTRSWWFGLWGLGLWLLVLCYLLWVGGSRRNEWIMCFEFLWPLC
jgi:hypothetical protein